ncbi:acylneuraminate cytidylyltransferase family protein [Kordia algicida OT-1]|uniref:CMP-N-acetylneuraminic acid synthetase n=1 Tax=Kordia algicida OT-1 TaxID=391587 RepID=A9ECZ9_9FLAO|nr:acylneuraminate cytidylyltransferase family protein [Kordia algicida]EDP94260.1 CMP-N-acetylneuraminic acid synthetase [Kordia algicida OT-1]
MNILVVIPARGGSKGVPGKNKKLLNGKPLIQYSIDAALQSKYISEVVVTTDDSEIITIAKSLGANVPFVRPKHLAEDATPTLPVIQHAVSFLQNEGKRFDAICLLQPTSPFRPKGFLDKALETFKEKQTDSLVSVLEVPHEYNPHWTFKANENGILQIATGEQNIIPRRQELPKAYHRDGSIYITKTEILMQENSLYGNSLAYIVSEKKYYVNIDTLADWEKATELAKTITL